MLRRAGFDVVICFLVVAPTCAAEPGVADWLEQLKSLDSAKKAHAFRELNKLGPGKAAAVPTLLDAIEREDEPIAVLVAGIVGRIGRPAVGPVLKRLGSADPKVQRRMLHVLDELQPERIEGPEREQVRDVLLERAKQGEETNLRILGRYGADGAGAAPYMLAALESADATIAGRMAMADALAGVGKAAVPGLRKAARNPEMWTRKCAVGALAEIGADAAGAIPLLVEMRMDRDWQVRRAAAIAIVKIGKSSVPFLMESLKSDDAFIRGEALVFLDHFGASSRSAISAVEKLQSDDDPFVRSRARGLLAKLNQLPDNGRR